MPNPPDLDLDRLLRTALIPENQREDRLSPFRIEAVVDASQGRGVFSEVLRVTLGWPDDPGGRPSSVVVKAPTTGPNGEAARHSGAYLREALAYRHLLPRSPIRAPIAHLVETDDEGGATLVLEDLSHHRSVDQLEGLSVDEAVQIATGLARFHHFWAQPSGLIEGVRANTPSSLAPEALESGLDALRDRWEPELDRPQIDAFQRVVADRADLVAAFAQATDPTLCHGDPRADNLVLDPSAGPILFDWQQIAIQLGEADLAWLAATSLTTEDRRRGDADLVAAYGTTTDRYRLGFVLPGLAVLLLAQRRAEDERSLRFIATSLRRIGSALDDLGF
jgi:hypothetical protein